MGYRKISVKRMTEAWEEYKTECNDHTVTRTEFSNKSDRFITAEVPNPITYTVKGFCNYLGLTEAAFYATYDKDPKFELVIARVKEECELNARERFEDRSIPSQLAGLWMSHYGYTNKTDTDISGITPVIISGGDDLED